MRRLAKLALPPAAALVLGWALLFGPLLPWSPWKPGWRHVALARADIWYPANAALPPAYLEFDRYIAASERFHQRPVTKRIQVFRTATWGQWDRLMPHLRNRGIGAATLATGTVIYVAPKLDEMRYDHGEFLRHELSHATLHQHQTMLASYRSGNTWMFEGLAVSFGEQKAFHTREQFLERARAGSLLPLIDPAARQPNFSMRMAYTTWRYFVEYLRARDAQRYERFLAATMADPREWRAAFDASFGDFPRMVEAFRQASLGTGTPY